MIVVLGCILYRALYYYRACENQPFSHTKITKIYRIIIYAPFILQAAEFNGESCKPYRMKILLENTST